MPNPAEIAARRLFLESLSAPTGPLWVEAPHASVNNPDWFRRIGGRPVPTLDREELHERILEQWRAENPHVVRDRSAILMAGPPGAGKSSTRDHLFGGRDQRHWRRLDADDFKRYLLIAAVEDGTLQELLPPDMRVAPGQQSVLYPFEMSALVHRESTDFLFNPAQRAAVRRGDNLVLDGTLAWKEHADLLVTSLSDAGYTLQVVDVEAPKHVAAARIVERWRQGYLQALNAQADPEERLGGRWLPPTALDSMFTKFRVPDGKPLHGKSVTEVNALEVSESNSAVTRFDLYRTATAHSAAEHVERRERGRDGGDLTVTWTTAGSPLAGHPRSVQKMLGTSPPRRPGPEEPRGPESDLSGRDAGPELST